MLKTKFHNIGAISFNCANCGKYHKVKLSQEVPSGKRDLFNDDPVDDFLGPPSNRILCTCGADLLILGNAECLEDFDVIWCNKKEMFQALVLKAKPVMTAARGLYYDLIRVPHGHVPVGKVWLWRRFPLLVKEFRGESYFKCAECGAKSFFKESPGRCQNCNSRLYFGFSPNVRDKARNILFAKSMRLARRDYFRRFLKDLEVLTLPVLALAGKAWYIRSERTHYRDNLPYNKRYFWRRF